ncbi:MAG: hydroxymethylbilane synthase [Chthoniobacterales bacterium]
MKRVIRLATRGSDLALAQTREVARLLRAAWPELEVHEEIIRTAGDKNLQAELSQIGAGEQGLFTKELEEALIDGRADAAVHSLKDLPTSLPSGLSLGAILPRADSGDVLVASAPGGLATLTAGAKVGTGSPRRQSMLRADRPDVAAVLIRGNVPTRLAKLAAGDYDAIIVAAAGLVRLGWPADGPLEVEGKTLYAAALPNFLPAPGQGAVAVEIRADDTAVGEMLASVHDASTATAVQAERAVLAGLGGGCHMALGARGRLDGATLHLEAVVFDLPGQPRKYAALSGDAGDPETLGRAVAAQLYGD